MNYNQIYSQIRAKKSFLCVGLDSDLSKLPQSVLNSKEPIFEFNKEIIDATAPYTIAYKPNLAFYESAGVDGFSQLDKTASYIKSKYPEIFLIADAKRGDIGNTAKQYAKAFFELMPFDAVTINPYMGVDSIAPFLEYNDKWAIILALTSNKSASEFEMLSTTDSNNDKHYLFERVILNARRWGSHNNIMFVAGATQTSYLSNLRSLAPDHFFLVPGVGAQGGDVASVAQGAINESCGLIINSSREIIFASSEGDFAAKAAERACRLASEMSEFIK